jgi:hypothetical protein
MAKLRDIGKRGRSSTLLGACRLVPNVVGDRRGRHGEARFADGGCSYDRSYGRSVPGHRREHAQQAPSLDRRAEAQDRGRGHGTECVGGDGGRQTRHQHRAILCLAATAVAARSARCRSQLRAELGGHRCGDERAACGDRHCCTAGAGHATNGGRAGGARSAGQPGRHDGARWCGRMAG